MTLYHKKLSVKLWPGLGSLLPTQYCAGGKIEKNEVGGSCGAYGGGERCAQGSSGETRGKGASGETQT